MKPITLTILKNISKKLFGNLSLHVWRLEGRGKKCHLRLVIYFLGMEKEKNSFQQLWFETNLVEEYLGKKNICQIKPFINNLKSQCTLVVIECNAIVQYLLKKKNDFFVPLWINGMVNIPLDISSKSALDDYRRIKNNNLSFTIKDRKEDFDHFYYTMYLPYINLRFDNQSQKITYNTMTKMISSHNCKLLIVKQDDLPLGGIFIILRKNHHPYIWILGVKNADLEYVRRGTIAALYYYSAQYLAQSGREKMLVGASRPFLNDGILKYKKKWGMYIISSSFTGLLFKPGNDSDSLSIFLQKNPFITYKNRKLYGTVFIDSGIKDQQSIIKQMQKEYMLRGIQDILFYQVITDQQKIIRIQ